VPDAGLADAPATVVRPHGNEILTAWRNFARLDFDPLLTAYCQDLPVEAIGAIEHTLGAIASIDEAAAAFRLPHNGGTPLPMFASLS
jgi:hypothetical protein